MRISDWSSDVCSSDLAAATAYRSLVAVASGYGENILIEHIQVSIAKLETERSELLKSIRDLVDSSESSEDQDELKRMRASALRDYTKARRQVARLVNEIEVLDFEIDDAEDFIRHLTQSLSDFDDSSVTFFALGHLAFDYCPACFAPVDPKHADHCKLCNTRRLEGGYDSRPLAVRHTLPLHFKASEAQVEKGA